MLNSEAAQSVMNDEYRSGFYRPEGFFDGLSLPGYGDETPVTREAFAYDFYPARGAENSNVDKKSGIAEKSGATEGSDSNESSSDGSSSVEPAPLLIWVHGGAWRFGTNQGLREVDIMTPEGPRTNRQTLMRRTLQEHGWAVASINYRYSHQAIFPGDLHDVKEAVRFFRARAAEFGIDPERIAIAGGSAGGHLSMMAALTGPDTAGYAGGGPELHEYYEGRASSSYPAVSSTVAAAVPFYGVSDLRTIFTDRPLAGYALDHPEDDGAEWRLLGCDYPLSEEHEWVEHVPGIGRERAAQNWERAHPLDLARGVHASSPIGETCTDKQSKEHTTSGKSAPIMLVHGIADSCVPYQQSARVYQALRARQTPTDMVLVPGAEHGDPRCFTPEIVQRMLSFLEATV